MAQHLDIVTWKWPSHSSHSRVMPHLYKPTVKCVIHSHKPYSTSFNVGWPHPSSTDSLTVQLIIYHRRLQQDCYKNITKINSHSEDSPLQPLKRGKGGCSISWVPSQCWARTHSLVTHEHWETESFESKYTGRTACKRQKTSYMEDVLITVIYSIDSWMTSLRDYWRRVSKICINQV